MRKRKYTNARVNESASDKNLGMRDSHFDPPNVGEMPHQPVWHSFPKRAFGNTNVSSCALQGLWFAK